VAGFSTVVTRKRDQNFSSIFIYIHRYWVIQTWSGVCLDHGRLRGRQRKRTERIAGGRGAMNRSEGFVRGSVLVYISGSFVPGHWSSVRGHPIAIVAIAFCICGSKPLLKLTINVFRSIYPDSEIKSRNSLR
jgi:hypothetical protein